MKLERDRGRGKGRETESVAITTFLWFFSVSLTGPGLSWIDEGLSYLQCQAHKQLFSGAVATCPWEPCCPGVLRACRTPSPCLSHFPDFSKEQAGLIIPKYGPLWAGLVGGGRLCC